MTDAVGPGPEPTDRRAALVASRLVAVATRAGLSDVAALEPGHPRGAAVRGRSSGRECWWVNPDGRRAHLGAVLAWTSARHDWRGQDLVVVVDADDEWAAVDARRARLFESAIEVRRLVDGNAAPVVPAPHRPPSVAAAEHLAFIDLIESSGADVVIEHGVVAGEVLGLEVCRVIDDPSAGATLAVGVGEHDRETFALVHGQRPVGESLASVVAHVAAHRAPHAPPHPLNRIARERLIRARAVAEPGLVGATTIVPVEPPTPRTNLKDAVPCLAEREDGSLVCFVSGVDLEAVPFLLDAADRRATVTSRAPSVAVRARDFVPALARVALHSATAVEILVLPDEIG